MIWPEFEDEDSERIPEKTRALPTGTARMWIVNSEMRKKVHRIRVKVGVKGFFMEGSIQIAKAEVIRVVGLHTNE